MTEWTRGDPAKAPPRSPLATGGRLDEVTLLAAYRSGVFPWYSEGEPVAWWCPDPRFVLLPGELRVTDSLRRTLRKADWRVTFDRDFEGVMRACAAVPRPGQDGTWITEDMVAAYVALHRRLVKLLSRPNRARAQISEAMRSKAKALRKKDVPVREIAAELGISIPSVYNITKD